MQIRMMHSMPDMLLDSEELRVSRFPSSNALVHDPVAEAQFEKGVRPWSSREADIFLDKFQEYGKNFREISNHLEGRSVGDCIVYYYQHQKVEPLPSF